VKHLAQITAWQTESGYAGAWELTHVAGEGYDECVAAIYTARTVIDCWVA
jgi:hypothetical protein